MRTAQTRVGFTLVELLAVIAILALLSALVAAGIGKVRSSQLQRNSEQTLVKLQLALDSQWKAVVDGANQDKLKKRIPQELIDHCGGNADATALDRAAALWAYMHTRREFPQTFAEATTAVTVGTGKNITTLQPRRTFAAASGGGDQRLEAAALLYLILSEKANRGMTVDIDEATQGAQTDVQVGSGSFRVFKDAWGTPITFIRYAQNAELIAAPFANTKRLAGQQDPLDPRGWLNSWGNATAKTNAQNAVGGTFDGQNKQPTVISAGANQNFDGLFDMDNLLGYKLRRQGDRGD